MLVVQKLPATHWRSMTFQHWAGPEFYTKAVTDLSHVDTHAA